MVLLQAHAVSRWPFLASRSLASDDACNACHAAPILRVPRETQFPDLAAELAEADKLKAAVRILHTPCVYISIHIYTCMYVYLHVLFVYCLILRSVELITSYLYVCSCSFAS